MNNKLGLVNGDSNLIPLEDECVDVCVTSPPYWALRDYDVEGQIGQESESEGYVQSLVVVFREVRRVLKPTGVLYLNLGDSFYGSGGPGSQYDTKAMASYKEAFFSYDNPNKHGDDYYKSLDKANVPHRVAEALRGDGWYWRSTSVWIKTNPMPESMKGWRWERHRVRNQSQEKVEYERRITEGIERTGANRAYVAANMIDERPELMVECPGCDKCLPHGGFVLRRGSWRPTSSHEYIFMFTKTDDYFADGEDIRENGGSRNMRDVITLAMQPFKGSHFACYPPDLVEPYIRSAASGGGVCANCGQPYARVIEREWSDATRGNHASKVARAAVSNNPDRDFTSEDAEYTTQTIDWWPTCECNSYPIPPLVLDPFVGSGTTLQVARKYGMRGVGIDLSYSFLHDVARQRLMLDKLESWETGIVAGVPDLNGLPLFTKTSDM